MLLPSPTSPFIGSYAYVHYTVRLSFNNKSTADLMSG